MICLSRLSSDMPQTPIGPRSVVGRWRVRGRLEPRGSSPAIANLRRPLKSFIATATFVTLAVGASDAIGPQQPASGARKPESAATGLPPIKRQPSPKAVVDEHLAAINACDWERVMAQYPPEVQFFLPGGQVVKGRAAVGELFRNFFKPVKDGGLCGLKFTTEQTFTVGDTINVQWTAKADFLAEPYKGADAYETQDGLMWAQVTTFDAAQLKLKK